MTPYVTVLMPAYNAEAFIVDAVNSILNQTYRKFEFIIIDDGSTDRTELFVTELEKRDPRIKYVKNRKNIGLAGSLNRGLKLSRGKYIVRMDADDVSLPERIHKQVSYMESHPEIGVSSGWVLSFGKRKKVWKCPGTHEKILTRLFCRNSLWHPAVILRKSVLENHHLMYNEAFKRSQDYDLWSRMAKISRFGNLQEILLKYRIHSNQMSNNESFSDTVRLRAVEDLLERTLTHCERDLHKLLFSKLPSCPRNEVTQIEDWTSYLKWINQKKNVYPMSYFNDILDHEFKKFNCNRFYKEISEVDRYRPSFIKYFLENKGKLLFSMPLNDIAKITIKSLLWYPNNYNNNRS